MSDRPLDIYIYSLAAQREGTHNHEYTQGLVDAYASWGHRVFVLATPGPRLVTGAEVVEVQLSSVAATIASRWPVADRALIEWFGLRRVRGLALSNTNILVIESAQYLLWSIAARRLLRRTRSVTVVHDVTSAANIGSRMKRLYMARLMPKILQRLAASASAVAVHGEAMARRVRGLVGSDHADAIVVVPYGASTDAHAEIPRARADDAPRTALIFGNLRRDKDYDTVLQALSRLPLWQLLVVGQERGITAGSLRARAEELGVADRIEIHARFIPDSEVAGCFAAADLVISLYPTPVDHESGPVHLARQFLRPVIFAGGQDVSSYVHDAGVGWAVPCRDPAAVVDAMEEAQQLSAPDYERLGRRLLAARARSGWQHTADALLHAALTRR